MGGKFVSLEALLITTGEFCSMNAVLLFESLFKIVLKFNRILESLFGGAMSPIFTIQSERGCPPAMRLAKAPSFF